MAALQSGSKVDTFDEAQTTGAVWEPHRADGGVAEEVAAVGTDLGSGQVAARILGDQRVHQAVVPLRLLLVAAGPPHDRVRAQKCALTDFADGAGTTHHPRTSVSCWRFRQQVSWKVSVVHADLSA